MSNIQRRPIKIRRKIGAIKKIGKINHTIKGGVTMKQLAIHATPILTGEDAKSLVRDAMRIPTPRMKKKHEMMLEVLERVTK